MQNYCNSKIFKVLRFIILNVIFLLFVVTLYKGIFGNVIKAEMVVNYKKDNLFTLFYTDDNITIYNDDMAARCEMVRTDNEFIAIPFAMNSSKIRGLKLHFGYKGQEVQVKRLTIKTPFKQLEFDAQKIKDTFTHVSKDIQKVEVKDGVLFIHPKKVDAFMYTDNMGEIIKNAKLNYSIILFLAFASIILTAATLKLYEFLLYKGLLPRKFAFIALFILILYIPNLFLVSGMKDGDNTEQRGSMMVDLDPNISGVEKTIKKVETMYNDHFGLRNLMIRLEALSDFKFFKTPSTEKVVLGKEGWLYCGLDNGKDITKQYRGITKFTPEELSKIKTNLEQRKAWLEKKGIPFVLVIAPDKETIYPEYYNNEKYKKVSNESRLDQLMDYLHKNSNIDVLDLRKILLDNKSKGRLYYKTDTHWNQFGGYFGYEAIMKEVGKYIKNVRPLTIDKFNIVKEYRVPGEGDLANMLSLPNQYGEEHILLQPKIKRTSIPYEEHKYDLVRGAVMKNPNKSLPKLLMFRDSFTVALGPYMSEHFSEAVYEWSQNFDDKLVKQCKPDIVIQETVERNLDKLLYENPISVK
ncbi:alginate O-acetyltransferase AlgX-related protein [Hathewaya limosa]|uniref:AlgX/AlgJ SGNH hydrolase-like domain-containing protein n=1 Tax=Hathewaya limosa TaxID=1536 RepID=A0ABU0JTB5_HATLI|nr:hypothetical protein [Hathewaya limosa]MDQ0479471.1 hypothetical protein [Hathewaya limosa]